MIDPKFNRVPIERDGESEQQHARALLALLVEREPRFPHITVQLLAYDGASPLLILGRVATAMRRAGVADEDIGAFVEAASGAGVGHMLRTCCDWVVVT